MRSEAAEEIISYLSQNEFPLQESLLYEHYDRNEEIQKFIDWIQNAPKQLVSYLDSRECNVIWFYYLKNCDGIHDYVSGLNVSPFKQLLSQFMYLVASKKDGEPLIEAAEHGSLRAIFDLGSHLILKIGRQQHSIDEIETWINQFKAYADRLLSIGHLSIAQIYESLFKLYDLDMDQRLQVLNAILFHYKLSDKLISYSEEYVKICYGYTYKEACRKDLLFFDRNKKVKTIQDKLCDLLREINNQPIMGEGGYHPDWLSLEKQAETQSAALLEHLTNQPTMLVSPFFDSKQGEYHYNSDDFFDHLMRHWGNMRPSISATGVSELKIFSKLEQYHLNASNQLGTDFAPPCP